MNISLFLAESLCDHRAIDIDSIRDRLTETEQQLLVQLYNAGYLIAED